MNGLEVGAMHDRKDQIRDADAETGVLSGLLPDTKYRVHIYALTPLGRGEGTFIEVRTTLKSGTFSCFHLRYRRYFLSQKYRLVNSNCDIFNMYFFS